MDEPYMQWAIDQMEAAEVHARKQVKDLGARFGEQATVVEGPDDTDELDDQFRNVYRAIHEDEALMCPHLSSPQPAWSFMGAEPVILRCENCHMQAMGLGMGMVRHCQICETGPADYFGICTSRFLVMTFACCKECREDQDK